MRTNLARMMGSLERALEANGTDVRVSWVVYMNLTIDPVTQSKSGTPTPMQMVVKAFLHFPQPAGNSAVKQFNEIETGDCIADFHQDVEIDGLEKLEFVFLGPDGNPIDGHKWVVKPIGEKLAQSWSAVLQGQRLLRPVLLRKAT